MQFLAAVLTFQYQAPHNPLTHASWPQLRQDIVAAFFPTEQSCQRLLTVTCLHSDHQQAVLRLTVAEQQQGQAYTRILHRVHSGRPIHLCQGDAKISVVDLSHPIWTGMSSWADFQRAPNTPSFRFAFTTPLITATPQTTGFPDALPFPEPETIFLRALEQWQNLTGPPFPWSGTHILQAARCVLANYHLQTVKIAPEIGRTVGYRGWIEYSCLQPQAEEITALVALAHMTFFTGCGYETLFGFGTTRVVLRT